MVNIDTAIEPIYQTERANQAIILENSLLHITWPGHQFTCPGEASLRLEPNLRLTLKADISGNPEAALAMGMKPISLQFGDHARPVNVLMIGSTWHQEAGGSEGTATFVPNPERLTICDDRRKRLSNVTFHVMNFPAFRSQGRTATDISYEASPGKVKILGRVILEHEGWEIDLQTLPKAGSLIKQLEVSGGFAITHVGRLKRKNGGSFWISQAEVMLQSLHQFLSFARGLWVPLVLPVGVDRSGDTAFEEWGVRKATAWEPRISWFDAQYGQTLAMLFSGFIDLMHDSEMGEPVKAALYWYLNSNRAGEGAGVDSGVILSQAALERLTNAYLVRTGLSTGGSTTQRFRRAFRHLKLPINIPKRMSAVYAGQRKGVWADLPEAIVKVRNELTHPTARLPFPVGRVVSAVWQVAQWYIELSILTLAGYRGVYWNRLHSGYLGDVEQVPWAR